MNINPSQVTEFVGKHIKQLNRLVVDITENREAYEAIKAELLRVGNIILAERSYFDQDEPNNRITNARYDWYMPEDDFMQYLERRIELLKDSKVMKQYFKEIDDSMVNINLEWIYQEPLIKFEKELLNFMKPVLGFGADEVFCLSKRAEAIEIITGLILTHPFNRMGLTRV